MVSTYAQITDLGGAAHYVQQMVNSMSDVAPEKTVLKSVRRSAEQAWKIAEGSPAEDADERALGASLVIFAINKIEEVQS